MSPQRDIVNGGAMPESPETEVDYAEMDFSGQRMVTSMQKSHCRPVNKTRKQMLRLCIA
jgi:hypothetical protein